MSHSQTEAEFVAQTLLSAAPRLISAPGVSTFFLRLTRSTRWDRLQPVEPCSRTANAHESADTEGAAR